MGSNHFRADMPRLVEFYMRGKLHDLGETGTAPEQ
jgi:hypothetical protein